MSTPTPPGSDEADPRPVATRGPALDIVTDLAEHLEHLTFPLEIPGAARARELRQRILAQITTHLIPRLAQIAAPAILVVGGPTGAGKSTLVNTLAGAPVSRAGVLRPTTRRPVLVVHPDDLEHVADHPVAELADVVTAAGVPAGLALLDAPDLDSVDEANRRLAVELVETADVWLFVTTATRYGDALPWEILDVVRRRGVSIGVVLDRVGADVLDVVRRDLLSRLVEAGFGSVPLFVVPDAGPIDGLLPERNVKDVAQWLSLLATRAGSRGVTARTVRGVWGPLRAEVRELLDAVEAQVGGAESLAALAARASDGARTDLGAELDTDALADGAPTTRWLAGAGSRGPLEPLSHDVRGFLARRRIPKQAPQRGAALEELVAEVGRSFVDVVGRAGAAADDAVRRAWTDDSAAGAALAGAKDPATAARDRAERVREAWAGWLGDIVSAAPSEPSAPGTAVLDEGGRRQLLVLAAVGIEGAVTAARRQWGADRAEPAIAAAREALRRRALTVVEAETAAFTASLTRDLEAEAVTALRVRVGELRVLAGED